MSNWHDTFNWNKAIEINRDAILDLLVGFLALMGIDPTDQNQKLPRVVRYAFVRLLKPAESAARRLILIASKDVEVEPSAFSSADLRSKRSVPGIAKRSEQTLEKTREELSQTSRFRLIDPRKNFAERTNKKRPQFMPRISVPGIVEPTFPEPKVVDEIVDCTPLLKRYAALKHALDDIPKQARRMARLTQKTGRTIKGKVQLPPMRPGLPPGYVRRSKEPIHEILMETDRLAKFRLE